MAEVKASKCPGCGAPVNILDSAKSVNCEYCGSILHVEKKQEKVQIKDTQIKVQHFDKGPLKLGSFGFVDDVPFKLVGVIEYMDDEGWKWPEYYLNFKDGRKGWLVYDEGEYTLLFEVDIPGMQIPKTKPGSKINIGGDTVKIEESGGSRIVYQYGQIPFTATPNIVIYYIDGKSVLDGSAYSIEYTSKETEVFKGYKVNTRMDGQYVYLFRA